MSKGADSSILPICSERDQSVENSVENFSN